MKLHFEEIRKIQRSEPMPEPANSFIKNSIPAAMMSDGVGSLIELIEKNKWFGPLEYPEANPKYCFHFRYGVCQRFTTRIASGNAVFYMNTNNPNVDFGRKKDEGN